MKNEIEKRKNLKVISRKQREPEEKEKTCETDFQRYGRKIREMKKQKRRTLKKNRKEKVENKKIQSKKVKIEKKNKEGKETDR